MTDILFKKQEGWDIFEFLNGEIKVSLYNKHDAYYEKLKLNKDDVNLLYEKMKEYFEGKKQRNPLPNEF